MYPSPRYLPFGDCGLLVEFGNTIDPETNRRVLNLDNALQEQPVEGAKEFVPTYRSLLIRYDQTRTTYEKLCSDINDLEQRIAEASNVNSNPARIVIPVVYGGEFGQDLENVAKTHDLTAAEVVKLHSEKDYRVYMIGFVTGFPYLGEVDDRIVTPRLETPRLKVPAGSVGIAEKQTGIYPCEAPGGWRIIGKTPLRLFNYRKEPPAMLKPGDTVRFKPISGQQFNSLRESYCTETYQQ